MTGDWSSVYFLYKNFVFLVFSIISSKENIKTSKKSLPVAVNKMFFSALQYFLASFSSFLCQLQPLGSLSLLQQELFSATKTFW